MKILFINKFLYPKGGAETYFLKLGEYFNLTGHSVEYFGMDSATRMVSNNVGAYTSEMDFHSGSMLSKLSYPFKIIYSRQSRKKLRKVLDDFKPDVCHINNFNYQLTPSIILEIVKWRKISGNKCKIIYTAHDPQLVCPNHMCRNPNTNQNCEKCFGGKFMNCTKGNCIHGSKLRSVLGTIEAFFWNKQGVYKYIDRIICCSNFIKQKLDTNPLFIEKNTVLHNFVTEIKSGVNTVKKDYVLYFGRFSKEKGIETLINVAKELPQIRFVFAGTGPLEECLNGISNVENVGFKKGDELDTLIREARFTLCPSECYENCPFSVLESQMNGTPVIGADIGGIPELIEVGITGELFESGNKEALKTAIETLWNNPSLIDEYSENCKRAKFVTIEKYAIDLLKEYTF